MRTKALIVFTLLAIASASFVAQQAFTPARQGVRSWEPLQV
jgi:hypothetical protein